MGETMTDRDTDKLTSDGLRVTDQILTMDQVARIVQVDARTIRYLHHIDRLRGYVVGRELRWRPLNVNRYIRARRPEAVI